MQLQQHAGRGLRASLRSSRRSSVCVKATAVASKSVSGRMAELKEQKK